MFDSVVETALQKGFWMKRARNYNDSAIYDSATLLDGIISVIVSVNDFFDMSLWSIYIYIYIYIYDAL